MNDILAPETLKRIDAFYDATLQPKIGALDDPRRQIRWLITKGLMFVLPPLVYLIGGDLFDSVLPFNASGGTIAIAWVWLIGGLILALVKYLMPGIAAYSNYRSRFKQDIVSEIFKVVCPSAVYDPLQGITKDVFDAPGLFSTRGSFECDDRVRGRIGKTAFEASEVGRAYSTGTGKNARSYTVFHGLFFHLDSNQRLNGVVFIDPEKVPSHQIGDRQGLGIVTFDNPAFEKEFKVYASNESEARTLLTPAITEGLLTLRRKADKPVFLAFKGSRAYVGVHYGGRLFEPRIARSMSKEAVREIAEHFALVETIVGELNLNARQADAVPDESLLSAPGIAPNPLAKLAADKAGAMTTEEMWSMAASSIDDSAKDAEKPIVKPEGTRIRVDRDGNGLSITYGLRIGFWIMFLISFGGALLAASALRAPNAPAWAGVASVWARQLPPVSWLDGFAADAPLPWMIVGTVVFVLLALVWTGYVRRVVIEPDRTRVYRAFRPFPRVYRRPPYGKAMRINNAIYITKSDGVHVMNPTASPVLTEPEAIWLTSEMKRALRQA